MLTPAACLIESDSLSLFKDVLPHIVEAEVHFMGLIPDYKY